MSQRNRLFLICYDIADPQRLGRVARFLSKHACRVQYSVFAAELSVKQLDDLLLELTDIIDGRYDDVRAYPLPDEGDVALMGQQIFPDDVLLIRNGRNLLRLGALRSDA